VAFGVKKSLSLDMSEMRQDKREVTIEDHCELKSVPK